MLEMSHSKEIDEFEHHILQLNSERSQIAAVRSKLEHNMQIFNSTGRLVKQIHEYMDKSNPDKTTETVKQAYNDNLPIKGRSYSERYFRCGEKAFSGRVTKNMLRRRYTCDNLILKEDLEYKINEQNDALVSPRINRCKKVLPKAALSASLKTATISHLQSRSFVNDSKLNAHFNIESMTMDFNNGFENSVRDQLSPKKLLGSCLCLNTGDRERRRVHFIDEELRDTGAQEEPKHTMTEAREDDVKDVNNNDIEETKVIDDGRRCDTQQTRKYSHEACATMPRLMRSTSPGHTAENERVSLPSIVERRRKSLFNISEISKLLLL